MKSLHILKGGSGAGKGTRVCQLMEYLKSAGYNSETLTKEIEGKQRAIGKLFPGIGLFVPGKYNISNKSNLTSWNGVDYLHSSFKKAEIVRNMLKEIVEEYNIEHMILEGEPMFLSDKYRPQFLDEFYNPDHIEITYYIYDSREQYDERIIGRSGKKAGDTGWERCQQYSKEMVTSVNESAIVGQKCRVTGTVASEEAYIFALNWATKFNNMVGPIIDTSNLVEWCKANPMLRTVGESDPLNKSQLW